MTALLFDHLFDEPIDGLVVEAMGVGNVPPPAFDGVKRLRERGVPVVLVSRCPIGRPHDDYAYYGAGKNLKALGVIFGDYLNGQKARIKLMCALGVTEDHERLRKMFEWAE
jgi:L-asparaginase